MKIKLVFFITLFGLVGCSISYPCDSWSLLSDQKASDEFIFSVCKGLIPSYEAGGDREVLFSEVSKILWSIDKEKLGDCSVDKDRVDIGYRGAKYTFTVTCSANVETDGETSSLYFIGRKIENRVKR